MASASATVTFFSRAPRAGPKPVAAQSRTVSVVVPAHNAERFIGACVSSLLKQTLPPDEIIIVDDASTDGTVQAAARQDVKVLSLTRNSGAAYARSYGASKASGGIVAFLDSDCVAPHDWVESIVREFDADPALGGIGGRYSHPREKSATSLMATLEERYAHHLLSLDPLASNPPAGNSAFLREIWLNKRSGYENYLFRGINSGEDEFAFNELRKTSRIKYVHSLAVMHQPRGANGYFRRHLNRGRAWGLRFDKNMLSDTKGGLRAYGGYELFFGSAVLGLALISLLVALVFPLALLAFAVCLAVSLFLSRGFSSLIRSVNGQLQGPERITTLDQVEIFLLLPLRSACWVVGAGLFLLRQRLMWLRKQWNILLSIAHFWMPGRISKLFYFVTSACNARCEFCFNLENVENWKTRKPFELSLREVDQITSHLKRLPYLNLSGGEPFIRPDLADVIESFHMRCKTQWVTIPTNASLTKLVLETTQEILTRCPTMFLTIQISLDGMREAHDRSRKINGGFDAMIGTLEGLSRLRKWYPNLRVQIATCFDDFNVAQMPEMIAFCRDNFDYDQQLFYLIRETGKLITQSRNHLIPSFLKTVAENEEHEWSKHRRTLWNRAVRALQGVTYTDVVKIREEKKFFRPCHATQKFVTLYDDGQISPCEVLDSVKLGNVRDFNYDYYELIRRKEAADFYNDDIVKNKCNCDWMCAVPINMLYDSKIIPRVAKALVNPNKLA